MIVTAYLHHRVKTMEISSFLTFSALAFSMTAAPGPNMFLVLHHAAGGSLTRAGLAISGICLSVFAHGILVFGGLSLLLSGSPLVLISIKLTGAAYIFHLGILALRAYSNVARHSEKIHMRFTRLSYRRQSIAFRHGFFTGFLNPYSGIFILTVVPQFMLVNKYSIPLEFGLLIITLASIQFLWFGSVALLMAKLAQRISSMVFTRLLNLISGVAMILLSMSLVYKVFA